MRPVPRQHADAKNDIKYKLLIETRQYENTFLI